MYLFNLNISLKINFNLYVCTTIRYEHLFLSVVINYLSFYNLYYTSFFFIREFLELIYLILKLKDFYLIYTYLQRVLHTLII